jgi:galactokinase
MHAFRVPGRVNLIGGQVDYHEGWIVAMAIDRDVQVVAARRGDGRITARSGELDGTVDVAADGHDDPTTVEPAWGRTIAGVARVLADRGRPPVGCALEIASRVPIGAGLSSSAAVEVACALALCDVAHFPLAGHELARAAQEAEHAATGVPCGIQDQMTSVYGRDGHALFLDCRTLDVEHLRMPDEVEVLVVHSGVPRTLEHTGYARRRAESLDVAARVGVRVLRDATFDQVRDLPRGRHVVGEMRRVRAFADALRSGDVAALGRLMLASHASSRDDMGVSSPELDALVECLCDAGALGARLTGAGFGGCAVALVPAGDTDTVAAKASAAYQERTGRDPTAWVVHAAAGAERVS